MLDADRPIIVPIKANTLNSPFENIICHEENLFRRRIATSPNSRGI